MHIVSDVGYEALKETSGNANACIEAPVLCCSLVICNSLRKTNFCNTMCYYPDIFITLYFTSNMKTS